MVVCIVGLVVFGILGIFSAKYRRLAKEAFRCVSRMATLRPCETGFDKKMKASITSKAMKRSPKIAGAVYRNFRVLSWLFVIAFFASTAAIGWGLYNYWAFGNCNGPQSSAFCVFSGVAGSTLSISGVSLDDHYVRGNANNAINIIEFACLQCPYSRQAEGAIRRILDAYPEKVRLTFFFFPLPQHRNGQLSAMAALCAGKQGSFWEYHDLLFEKQSTFGNDIGEAEAKESMKSYAVQLGLDSVAFDSCLDSEETKFIVRQDYETGKKLGLEGTPTFFIGDRKLTGPQAFETFRDLIDSLDSG